MNTFNINGSCGGSSDIKNMLEYLKNAGSDMAVDVTAKDTNGYVIRLWG